MGAMSVKVPCRGSIMIQNVECHRILSALLPATNRTAASSVTVFIDGLKVSVMLPAAVTVAGAESWRLSVCCSPLPIFVLSKFQTSEDSGGENPVPASAYVRVPTVSVPENADPVAGLN